MTPDGGSTPQPTSWTCEQCGVRVSFSADSASPAIPEGWEQIDGAWTCLGCRRRRISEGLVAGPQATVAAQRRRALTEFELLRHPEDPDHVIARRAHCQPRYVAPVRAALIEDGRLPQTLG